MPPSLLLPAKTLCSREAACSCLSLGNGWTSGPILPLNVSPIWRATVRAGTEDKNEDALEMFRVWKLEFSKHSRCLPQAQRGPLPRELDITQCPRGACGSLRPYTL